MTNRQTEGSETPILKKSQYVTNINKYENGALQLVTTEIINLKFNENIFANMTKSNTFHQTYKHKCKDIIRVTRIKNSITQR
jgi:hypothetical protein